jgi:hypothetical protein
MLAATRESTKHVPGPGVAELVWVLHLKQLVKPSPFPSPELYQTV